MNHKRSQQKGQKRKFLKKQKEKRGKKEKKQSVGTLVLASLTQRYTIQLCQYIV